MVASYLCGCFGVKGKAEEEVSAAPVQHQPAPPKGAAQAKPTTVDNELVSAVNAKSDVTKDTGRSAAQGPGLALTPGLGTVQHTPPSDLRGGVLQVGALLAAESASEGRSEVKTSTNTTVPFLTGPGATAEDKPASRSLVESCRGCSGRACQGVWSGMRKVSWPVLSLGKGFSQAKRLLCSVYMHTLPDKPILGLYQQEPAVRAFQFCAQAP